MVGKMSIDEAEILSGYWYLHPKAQREVQDYLRYLLCKQYQREVKLTVFNNRLLHNLFQNLLSVVEKEDFDIGMAERRIAEIKEIYYGLFEQVHQKYSEFVCELDSNEIVREFGRNAFENVGQAMRGGNLLVIRLEIIDFYQDYCKLSQNKELRQIIAV
ncbi:MAG: hypothetical protein LBR98_04650 [Syntrophomonadaceae bacterium]|jgi:hypothetical protein|nr:hypothetical protein [Syntrophomonadaceae bacterium]